MNTLPNGWTIEWRADIRKWEVMQGSAHRGLYDSEDDARAVVQELAAA
jgi:hypothetical protein